MLQEPIEVCQLLPTRESPYTASDDWWKQALNKQQTFSVDDIGEWPEREQDEQYVIQIERIVPTKSAASSKMALGEKDINVETGAHDAVGHYQNETATTSHRKTESTGRGEAVPFEAGENNVSVLRRLDLEFERREEFIIDEYR